MPVISPGAVCTIKQYGAQLWICHAPASGGFWYLVRKTVGPSGTVDYQKHTAGAGDVVPVIDARVYTPGQIVRHDGIDMIALRDAGDEVELGVPDSPYDSKSVDVIHVSNRLMVSKATLILDDM